MCGSLPVDKLVMVVNGHALHLIGHDSNEEFSRLEVILKPVLLKKIKNGLKPQQPEG